MPVTAYKLKDSFTPVIFLLPQNKIYPVRIDSSLRFCFINKAVKWGLAKWNWGNLKKIRESL